MHHHTIMKLFILLFLTLLLQSCHGTGKGPIGIYAISDRYILISDSNFDALFVLDILHGGIVGHRILHSSDENENGDGEKFVSPTGVATCDTCNDIFLSSTSRRHFYRIKLDKPLKDMASDNGNFTSLSNTEMDAYWPWEEDAVVPSSNVRMIAIKGDGSVGYLASMDDGLLQFDPRRHTNPSILNKRILDKSNIPGTKISGCTFTRDETHLLLTGPSWVTSLDLLSFQPNNNVSFSKIRFSEKINLESTCSRNDDDGHDNSMHFRDAVLLDDNTMFVVGHTSGGHNQNDGMVLYSLKRITAEDGTVSWMNCEPFAGQASVQPGWVDGYGDAVRFSRPHSMVLLPSSDVLVITDIDNRAVRLADLEADSDHFGEISTISYDEHLWERLYGDKSLMDVATSTIFESLLHGLDDANELGSLLSYDRAMERCSQASGGRLCGVADIREAWVESESWNESSADSPIILWTAESCHSCWLHVPGVCPKPKENESADIREGSAWGAHYHMVAKLFFDDGKIQTLCTHDSTAVKAQRVCCVDKTANGNTTSSNMSDFTKDPAATVYGGNSTRVVIYALLVGTLLLGTVLGTVAFIWRRNRAFNYSPGHGDENEFTLTRIPGTHLI